MSRKRELTPELYDYLFQVTVRHSGIESIWLVGSRANGTATETSDWDFIVFGSTKILENLKDDEILHRPDVDFLVVLDDGNSFERPWGRRKRGSLASWKWVKNNDSSATYVGTKWFPDQEQVAKGRDMGDWRSFKLRATRIWPSHITHMRPPSVNRHD